jgi:CMP-N,N'-diacetyllegionaminic acid synthase
LLKLNNKPLIAWSIQAALKSKYIDEVVVSTDNSALAKISKKYGATVPFKRPKKFATDHADKSTVIKHAIQYYQKKKLKFFDYVIYLQPTSPLRNVKDIDKAIRFMFEKKAEVIASVCELDHPLAWTGQLPKDNNMRDFFKNPSATLIRSQDFKKSHRLNGAIFIVKTKSFLRENNIFKNKKIFAYKMPKERSIDIDTYNDLKIAEVLIR